MACSTPSATLLRQRLVLLLKALPAAQAGDEASLHQARVASRRLRGVLPILGASVDRRALGRARRRVRRITRALGPVRELDVAILLLAEVGARDDVSPAAIDRVRQAVTAERSARRKDMLAEITPARINTLRRRLVEVAVPDEAPMPPANEIAEAAQQAATESTRLRAAIERAGGLYLANRLHRVRVAAKKLRYALEVQRDLTHSRSTARVNRVKALQDLLGRINDLEVLIDRVRGVQETLPMSDRTGMSQLDGLVRALEGECREGHAAYLRARSATLKLCDGVIEAIVPGRPRAVA